MKCPRCERAEIIKNGKIHNGNQRYKCKICGRQLVENPQNRQITPETKKIIANCWLEKVSLREIHRITRVAVSGIQEYSNEIYRQALLTSLSSKKKSHDYRMWSYVGNKTAKPIIGKLIEAYHPPSNSG